MYLNLIERTFVLTFILIFLFIFFVYLIVKAFKQLRKQNVGIPEAIFLSFIYSISTFGGRVTPQEDMQISREKIWKQAKLLFIFIFGILLIASICMVQLKLLFL